MADSLFPELFPEDKVPGISHAEVAVTIRALTEVAAACALIGDIDMGRAFLNASTQIVAVAMSRWPDKFPAEEFNPAPSSADSAPDSTETTMQENPNGGQSDESRVGTDQHNPNGGAGETKVDDVEKSESDLDKSTESAEPEPESDAGAGNDDQAEATQSDD